MNPNRFWIALASSAGLLAIVAVSAPLIGSAHIDYARAWAGQSPDHEILFYVRLPRVLLALIAGGTLAVTGVLFQAILREPLAEPFTLGISSGSSLGAVLAICFGWTTIFGVPGTWVSAFIGAAGTLVLVLAIAFERRRVSSFTLLLAGVSINSIAMATILFLHNVATFSQSFAITRWLMGGLDAVEYPILAGLAAIIVPVVVALFWRARDWNLLAVGEEWASSRGVNATRMLVVGYIAGSLMTGSVTAFTGPIGFIGLIVPHALRIIFGADHRVLIPCSFLIGAAFLVVCDTVARTILSPTEVPVGVITAMLGGPFFIWLLRSKRRSLWL
ncbi:MAG: iron ABC transporter permease [Acidobacteria bacterium]|nr:iron ABC transporter permease [Acidobacteriota bacterium]